MNDMPLQDNISTHLEGFKDILLERRLLSDFLWATRDWNPVSAYGQLEGSYPSRITSYVRESLKVVEVVLQLSEINNIHPKELYEEVNNILNEITYGRKVHVLRWLAFFTSKILKKICSQILINEKKLLQIKSDMGQTPLLFLPTHRSYGDFIILSYICFTFEIEIPRIAAGMDFKSMVFMNRILRDSCAFFMRRSFVNDLLYLTTFSQYVETLVTLGNSAIEFFIEGTRSRTAKSLVPKYGFLSMALKPFFTGKVPDIQVVPINLSYDRVMEEILFAYELLGVPKPKESTKGFLKALSILNESYGNVYVQFGEPLSIAEFFGKRIDRIEHNFGPVDLQELTPNESKQIVRLAHHIIQQQNNLTVLSCFNVIAAVLNDHLMKCSTPLSLADLIFEVAWISSLFRSLGATTAISTSDISRDVLSALSHHKSMVTITSDRKIKLLRLHSKNGHIDERNLKGHNLSDRTMDVAVPILLVQYYSNPCAHFIVNLALIMLIVECIRNDKLTADDIYNHFKCLRLVFAKEFVFSSESEAADFENALQFSKDANAVVVESGSRRILRGDNVKLRQFCVNFLRPYIPSYLLMLEVLMKQVPDSPSEPSVLKAYQQTVEMSLNRGSHIHPAALSLDLATNALNTFSRVGAITKKASENPTVYELHQNELEKLWNQLKLYEVAWRSGMDLSQHFTILLNGKL